MILDKLKDHIFERHESFPSTSVIFWEYAMRGLVNNPGYEKFGNGKTPNLIALQNENFEEWQETKTKLAISDPIKIKEIISESYAVINKYEKELKDNLKKYSSSLSKADAIKWLRRNNEILIDLYNNYTFYTEEYFDTRDENLLKELPEVRNKLSNFVDLIWNACEKILEYIKKEYQLTRKVLNSLNTSEIIDILEGKADINKMNEFGGRPIGYIILDDKIEEIVGSDVLEVKKFLESQENADEQVKKAISDKKFYGMVACRGKARGEVIKISLEDYGDYEHIFKQKKDYVLVSPMTRPEIVPYLEHVVAIVTDEGGITCHASIISREFDKPCIVGTDIATKVLKNGDEVEVDANNGIVRIIAKKK